jgi:hypothetical protein
MGEGSKSQLITDHIFTATNPSGGSFDYNLFTDESCSTALAETSDCSEDCTVSFDSSTKILTFKTDVKDGYKQKVVIC